MMGFCHWKYIKTLDERLNEFTTLFCWNILFMNLNCLIFVTQHVSYISRNQKNKMKCSVWTQLAYIKCIFGSFIFAPCIIIAFKQRQSFKHIFPIWRICDVYCTFQYVWENVVFSTQKKIVVALKQTCECNKSLNQPNTINIFHKFAFNFFLVVIVY